MTEKDENMDLQQAEPEKPDISDESENIKPRSEINPNARWYVLHTLSGQELNVKQYIENSVREKGLENLILRVFIPTEDVVEMRHGKKRTVQKKFFPGYILVLMEVTKITKAFIKNVPGVMGFITAGDTPVPLSDEELESIVQRTKKEKAVQKMDIPFSEGDPVKVIDGPFKDFTGVVSEVNGNGAKLELWFRFSAGSLLWMSILCNLKRTKNNRGEIWQRR